METFKDFQQMGRFTLRDEGKISGGGGGRTRLQCSAVVCMETFKDFQQMGRFTLRDEGKISGEGG